MIQNQLKKKVTFGFVALVFQLGMIAKVFAGGASVLHLPIDGITEENKEQCVKIMAEKFAPVLTNWRNGLVEVFKDDSTYFIQLRPERGQLTLSEIEKALDGSPFSIKRDHLEYFSLIRLHLGKMEDREKHVKALSSVDGKKIHSHTIENPDGTVLVILRDTLRNKAVPVSVHRSRSLMTHKRLTDYLSKNKIDLLAISWGDHSRNHSKGWRGDSFGARPVSGPKK